MKSEIDRLIASEVASIVFVLTIAMLIYRLDIPDLQQRWIAAAIVLGGIVAVVGICFGSAVYNDEYIDRTSGEIIYKTGVLGAIWGSICAFVFCAIVIAFVAYAVGLVVFGMLGLIKAITSLSLFAPVLALYPAGFAATIVVIAIYELVIPLSSLAAKTTLLMTGVINFGILYVLPKLI